MSFDVPESVIASVTGHRREVVDIEIRPLHGGTGAATAELARLTVRVLGQHRCPEEFRLVRKVFRPLRHGRHSHGAEDPRHWTYWKREPLAYASDLLPSGPGLRAPRCHGAFDSTIYLEDVESLSPEPTRVARQLGSWQSTATVTNLPWLSGHQLAQRIEASDLDWAAVHADSRAAILWAARHRLLVALSEVPVVLSHGDFHQGNLCASGRNTVVLDWGTLGLAPVGADLAHLALSSQQDLQEDYLAGLRGRFPENLVILAYRATLVLVGASRVHWMLSSGNDVPEGYVDFLWAHRPRGT